MNLNPTRREREAGVERLNQFGIINVIDSLADGDLTKYEEVLQMDCNTVFTKMKMNIEKVKIQRKMFPDNEK